MPKATLSTAVTFAWATALLFVTFSLIVAPSVRYLFAVLVLVAAGLIQCAVDQRDANL